MKHLTPDQIYWITLLGIAACCFLMGFAVARALTDIALQNVGHDGDRKKEDA